MNRVPMTVSGEASLKEELERLKKVVRAEPSARIRQLLTSQLLVGIPKGTDRYLDSLSKADLGSIQFVSATPLLFPLLPPPRRIPIS